MTPASRALLYGEDDEDDTLTPEEMTITPSQPDGTSAPKTRSWVTILLALIVLGVVGIVGWLLWRTFDPSVDPSLPQEDMPEDVTPDESPSE